MIRGIGLDLVETQRVRRALERFGERFLRRVLTGEERRALHGDPAAYLAARLAGKEAAFKALGTERSRGVTWRQIEILNTPSGAPQVRFHGIAGECLRARGAWQAHVTLTHTRGHAAAAVVLEGMSSGGPQVGSADTKGAEGR